MFPGVRHHMLYLEEDELIYYLFLLPFLPFQIALLSSTFIISQQLKNADFGLERWLRTKNIIYVYADVYHLTFISPLLLLLL